MIMPTICPYCKSKNVKVIRGKTLCKEGTPLYPNRQIEITQQTWKCNSCQRKFTTEFTF